MLWVEAQRWSCRPSELVGLKSGSYEAYCLDQAVGFVGASIQRELEEAVSKPSAEERRAQAAQKRILEKYVGSESDAGFADPAALFG